MVGHERPICQLLWLPGSFFGSPAGLFGTFWGLLELPGASWGLLGPPGLGPLGASWNSWGPLGPPVASFGASPGASWDLLGASGASSKASYRIIISPPCFCRQALWFSTLGPFGGPAHRLFHAQAWCSSYRLVFASTILFSETFVFMRRRGGWA